MELHARGSVIDGKYTIIAKLREGGMGAIYKVHHNLLDEVRVIKVMRPSAAEQDEMRRRFGQEAKIVTRLKHHNIASVYDFAIDDEGTAYIVMEYVDGVNLAEVARSIPAVPVAFVLEVTRQTLEALSYLHRKNIAHRDISPDNIMCTEEDGQLTVKLVDLGIAKDLESTGTATKTGLFLGKLKYASPEQLGMLSEGQPIDGRSDLYSLGVVMYQLVTQQMPIAGETAQALIAGHLFHAPIAFDKSDPGGYVPFGLREIIMRALEKKREDRWPNADAFRDAVVALQQMLPLPNATDMRAILQRARTVAPEAQPEVSVSAQERVARQFHPDDTTARTIDSAVPTVMEFRPPSQLAPTVPIVIEKRRRTAWPFVAIPAAAALAVAGWVLVPRKSPPPPPPPKKVANNQPDTSQEARKRELVTTGVNLANKPDEPIKNITEPSHQQPKKKEPVKVAASEPRHEERQKPAPPGETPKPIATTSASNPPVQVVETARPEPPVQPPVAPKGPTDDELIRKTVTQFARAQEALDPALYAKLFPSAPVSRVAQSYAQLKSQTVELSVQDVVINGHRATVRAQETRTIVPKAGAEQHMSRETRIVLEKNGDAWVVAELR